MGLFLRGKIWWIGYSVGGRQRFESSHSRKKRDARQLLEIRQGAAREGRLRLTKSNAPRFEEYARSFLLTVQNLNTRKRYGSSICNLIAFFGNVKLADITGSRIEEFKERRLLEGVRTATVNRDLAVLRRMMKLAERKLLINESPFRDVDFLEEKQQRRRPHILTFEEEDRLLQAAESHIRALTILILETGMRSRREALSLRWNDVDFVNDVIRVQESKTIAGQRTIPMSGRCKAELLSWRNHIGSDFSCYVFPKMNDPRKPLQDLRRSWANALKKAGIPHFWQYDLRHTTASRLSQAGVSPIFVAQIIGHASTSILSTYARAIDEFRRDAIHKLETLRGDYELRVANFQKQTSGSVESQL